MRLEPPSTTPKKPAQSSTSAQRIGPGCGRVEDAAARHATSGVRLRPYRGIYRHGEYFLTARLLLTLADCSQAYWVQVSLLGIFFSIALGFFIDEASRCVRSGYCISAAADAVGVGSVQRTRNSRLKSPQCRSSSCCF